MSFMTVSIMTYCRHVSMRKLHWLLILLFAHTCFAAAQNTTRPNLNGTWNLDVAKSDFGQIPPPKRQSEEILQAGQEFAISVTLEREDIKQSYTLRFRVGGEVSPLAAGAFPEDTPFRILNVKGEWEGQTLVVTEKVTFQGSDGTVIARYTLSAGGKVLTKQTHVSMSAGEFDTRTVYDRE
jgi:hypothetical protein